MLALRTAKALSYAPYEMLTISMALARNNLDDVQELLLSDIETLSKLVFSHRRPLSEGDIRVASVVLRKWFRENLLGSLCNGLGVTATLQTLANQEVLKAINMEPSVNYFVTGGVRFNGLPYQGIYHSAGDLTSPLPLSSLKPIFLKIPNFKQQPRVYFMGDWFTCEEVITFTANKLGGVHFDTNRNERQAAMEGAAKFLTYGGPVEKLNRPPPGEMHLELEPNGNQALSGLHLEIIAAATSLISVRFDNKPLFEFSVKRSVWDGIKRLMGKKRYARFYEANDTKSS